MTKLVIVESPTKVKSISKFLPDDFEVASCVGHIRDLPNKKTQLPKSVQDADWADLGVNVDEDFKPYYVTIRGKNKVIKDLKKKLKDADELYLATDEDREGESISWHLIEALDPDVPVKRLVFNEITKEAIRGALDEPREIDMDLVQAQETRRILDRLYGYTLSPLLWKKIGGQGSLSAGRVQSPAVRLVVMRERERRAFRSGAYWDLKAMLAKDASEFEAKLVTVGGARVASSKDFDKDTGRIEEGKDVVLLDEEAATAIRDRIEDATWSVTDVEQTQRTSKPYPPFTTSTLQQAANNVLKMSARETMRVAQRLYENGWITYMRTDSTHLSKEALTASRAIVKERFGDEYLPAEPRFYGHKQAKGAQEAHEAIRPAGAKWKSPKETGLSGRERSLYDLIYKQTIASQMVDERYTSTKVTIEAPVQPSVEVAPHEGDHRTETLDVASSEFTATGKTVDFLGHRAVYTTLDEESDKALPELVVGDTPECREVTADGHETKPPSRYTEATLVKALEEEGIGRPSTYAEIIDKIVDRGYVVREGRTLIPSFTAFAVIEFLENHFDELVDLQFTASMEEALDEIAAGEAEWLPYLRDFFLGETGLRDQVDERMETIDPQEARRIHLEGLPEHINLRISRHGPYLEGTFDGEKVTADIPEGMTPDELDAETAELILTRRAAGPLALGEDPETGKPVYVLTGRYGPYVQLGESDDEGGKPPRQSLPKGMEPEECDLDEALFLLSLPRTLGHDPSDNGRIFVGISRFGPYVAKEPEDGGKADFRSLDSYDQMRHLSFEDGVAKVNEPKKSRRRGPTILKEFDDYEDKPLSVRDGRYGPYVQYGKKVKGGPKPTYTSIPAGLDPKELSREDAVFLASLPLEVGDHPDGGKVLKGIGRRGPYIAHELEDGSREYANPENYAEFKALDLEGCLRLLDRA